MNHGTTQLPAQAPADLAAVESDYQRRWVFAVQVEADARARRAKARAESDRVTEAIQEGRLVGQHHRTNFQE